MPKAALHPLHDLSLETARNDSHGEGHKSSRKHSRMTIANRDSAMQQLLATKRRLSKLIIVLSKGFMTRSTTL